MADGCLTSCEQGDVTSRWAREVDEYLETSVPGVYAMGDIKGGPAFTHLSYDDYRILRANLVRHEKASTRDRIVPYTMFIDPQLGRAAIFTHPLLAEGLNTLFAIFDA